MTSLFATVALAASSSTGSFPARRDNMSDPKDYPYVTLLDILRQPLELIDEKAISEAVPHKWWNQTLCQVNDSVVRLGVVQGEYHWHKHDDEDEFFYVVEGELHIDLEDRTIDLKPRQGTVIPKGVMHRPRAPRRTVMLMVETNTIVPTGS
jgi:mannose-6-phosphate isomerase-like protein (cupin superfamily)